MILCKRELLHTVLNAFVGEWRNREKKVDFDLVINDDGPHLTEWVYEVSVMVASEDPWRPVVQVFPLSHFD